MSKFIEVSKFRELVITNRRKKISSVEHVSKNASAPKASHIKSKMARVQFEIAMEQRF